jgi:hypothetical protein
VSYVSDKFTDTLPSWPVPVGSEPPLRICFFLLDQQPRALLQGSFLLIQHTADLAQVFSSRDVNYLVSEFFRVFTLLQKLPRDNILDVRPHFLACQWDEQLN